MAEYRDCLVCGKSFEVCNHCNKYVPEELQWRRVVCCPEHFNYHSPIISYVRKKMDKATAKNELQSAIDLYGEIDFCDNIKPIVAEIMAEDVVLTKQKKKNKTNIIVPDVVSELESELETEFKTEFETGTIEE